MLDPLRKVVKAEVTKGREGSCREKMNGWGKINELNERLGFICWWPGGRELEARLLKEFEGDGNKEHVAVERSSTKRKLSRGTH